MRSGFYALHAPPPSDFPPRLQPREPVSAALPNAAHDFPDPRPVRFRGTISIGAQNHSFEKTHVSPPHSGEATPVPPAHL